MLTSKTAEGLDDEPVNPDTQTIKAALLADGSDLSDKQTAALKDFIERIGGIENAIEAVDMLSELDEAA